jgi:predicted membrane channel-forming protein YqfA (hemolysin III family)
MEMLFLLLSVASIAVMLYALYSVFVLRHKIPGGKVRSTWSFLSGLIVMFSVAYLSTPFFRLLPQEIKDVLVGVIFLAGAIFVLIVIKLFFKIVEDIGL